SGPTASSRPAASSRMSCSSVRCGGSAGDADVAGRGGAGGGGEGSTVRGTGYRMCPLLDDQRPLHSPLPPAPGRGAAERVGGRRRLDRDVDRLAGSNVLVEVQGAREEAVRDVLARHGQGRPLPGLQVDLLRLELETFRGDRDRADWSLVRASCRSRNERRCNE